MILKRVQEHNPFIVAGSGYTLLHKIISVKIWGPPGGYLGCRFFPLTSSAVPAVDALATREMYGGGVSRPRCGYKWPIAERIPIAWDVNDPTVICNIRSDVTDTPNPTGPFEHLPKVLSVRQGWGLVCIVSLLIKCVTVNEYARKPVNVAADVNKLKRKSASS